MRLLPRLAYPKARRANTSDVLHGFIVDDPYRWLEDPDSPETKAFISSQNKLSRSFIDQCPSREDMQETLKAASDYDKFSPPFKFGSYYFYFEQRGQQNQPALYRTSSLDEPGEPFVDPNALSDDGTVALTDFKGSINGTYLAYSLSKSGSDWQTIFVKEIATGRDLDDCIERFRYSNFVWSLDEKGFFYGQYPDWEGHEVSGTDTKPADNQKVYYHVVGTSQDKDILVAEAPDFPKATFSSNISEDGKRLILTFGEDLGGNQVWIADIPENIAGLLPFKTIQATSNTTLAYVTNNEHDFYFLTNKDRPNFALVKLNVNRPDEWEDVVPEDPKRVMRYAEARGNDKLVVGFIQDAVSVVDIFDMEGKHLQRLPFELGTISLATGLRKESEVFFDFSSFVSPSTVYRCDVDLAPSAPLVEYRRVRVSGWSPRDVTVTQEFFTSGSNGTRVPMFVMHRAGQTHDGTAPAYLEVYGGFGVPMSPEFSMFRMLLIYTLGFVVAVANVRGGGEYGDVWHNAGRLALKQNTLDDVHYAARYLVAKNYTSADRVVLTGRSNGGFVTLASINQRPELFGAAIAEVPVTDLFRFHRFTVGHAWVSEYGNPDSAADFGHLRCLSPLHNVPSNLSGYPALLIATADHDDRVVPAHSLKFIAELQYRAEQMLASSGKHSAIINNNSNNNSNCLSSRLTEEAQVAADTIGRPTTTPAEDTSYHQPGLVTRLRPFLAIVDTKAGHGDGKPLQKVNDELADYLCFLTRVLGLEFRKTLFQNSTTDAAAAAAA